MEIGSCRLKIVRRSNRCAPEAPPVIDAIKKLIHEGNVRKVSISHDGHLIAEFPLTVGVVGAALAPVLAAIGAIAALVNDCTIEIERTDAPADPLRLP